MAEEEKDQETTATPDAGSDPTPEETAEPATEQGSDPTVDEGDAGEAAGSDPTPEAAPEPAPEQGSDPEPEAPADEPAPEEDDAPPATPPQAEPEEILSAKELRKAKRSRHSGGSRDPRSGEQRATERRETRAAKAAERRRYRARARERRGGERGEGTPPAEKAAGSRKVRLGTVVSSKPDKTITVRVELTRRHRTYEKVIRRSNTVHVHDERNEASEGDTVRVIECRPMSRLKRWRLLEIVERAR